MPRRICSKGKYAKDYFNRHGELRHIKKLRFWPLNRVLQEKYEFPQKEVIESCVLDHLPNLLALHLCPQIVMSAESVGPIAINVLKAVCRGKGGTLRLLR